MAHQTNACYKLNKVYLSEGNPTKNKRDSYIDIAKGIAIIAVVLSHTNHGLRDYNLFPLQSIVYGIWYVPLFFVLGGFS